MGADGHAARAHQHVGTKPRLERAAVGGLVVGDRLEPLNLCAGRRELCGEDDPVGVVDLAWLEL